MEKLIVVRDFAGKPLKRVVIAEADGLVYVSSPDLVEAVNNGESYPVGFPIEDVYLFEMARFSSMAGEYERVGRVDEVSWEKLKPYRLKEPAKKEAAN